LCKERNKLNNFNTSERKLKILIPTLSLGKSGGTRVLSLLSNYWKKLGNDVRIVSYYGSEEPYYPVDADMIWVNEEGIVQSLNDAKLNVRNSVFRRTKGIYKFLKNNSKEYDIVLANQNFSTWPVCFGSEATNFYYIQAYEPEFYSRTNIKGLIQIFMSWLTYYLPLTRVVNADIYQKYKNLNSNNVIPPGLDLNIYYPKENKDISGREFIVGCIGRKAEWKGSNDVGEAVKILRKKGYNIKFKVAFEPINYAEHELVKPDGDENLADFYRCLDVLVAPGHIQLGAVHYPVIEAMACKTPVVTTGYYPANDDNSFIVPVKRPDIIADTLAGIIGNYESAIKKTEIAYATISQFDWNIVSTKFLDVFNDELRRKQK
jgi:glycosyltransferase involved in cell wall biosynthesis